MDFAGREGLLQKSIGSRIRELRRAAGLSVLELAGRAGISQSQLSKIETGKATISIRVLQQLCELLQRPLSYLFQSEQEVPRVLGTLVTVSGPESQGLKWFAQEVHRRTDGRLSIIPLRASQLGSGADQARHLHQGVIDLFIEDLAHFQKCLPILKTLSLPYTFHDNEEVARFLAGPFFKEQVFHPLLERGIRLLNRRWNWLRGLEWVLVATRPILDPDEVRGQRVRVYDSPILARFWEEMGARPVVVPWHAVKKALRNGEIDILPTHKAHLYHLGFCRHARFVTMLGDACPSLCVAVNERKYQALPPDIQKALVDACDVAGNHFSDLVRTSEERSESLNISRFKAVYIRVDLDDWHDETLRVRRRLAELGELPAEYLNGIGKRLQASDRNGRG
ncbi:MAG: TRAP transporter substrate-binding protein DctP [Syntrophobacteraceae bacterium]|nr:TRAP transporter substrate-binding protein DctP [Desulfobacteraceae bacterium]